MRLTDVLRGKGKQGELEGGEAGQVWKEEIRSIAIDMIRPSRYQPRMEFGERDITELARSIDEHGILHPIVVRKASMGYELIVGERRLRACRQLGWDTIPAIVRDLADKASAELAMIENLQRKDLHIFEEAEGYRRLLEEFEITQEDLAKRLGKSQSSIANKLRLLKLPEKIQEIISREILSERHARALLRLDDEEAQLKVVNTVVSQGLNVKQTEELIDKILGKVDEEKPKQKRKIIFKDIRLFTNSLKKLTNALESSGLAVSVEEDDSDEYYRVSVLVKKPEGRDE